MKRIQICFWLVVPHLLQAQEIASKWDIEIVFPISDGTPSKPIPKPEPLDLNILSSRTTRMEITQAPEMPELPLVTVTVHLGGDPKLTDPPPRLPTLPPDDPTVVSRLVELKKPPQHPTRVLVRYGLFPQPHAFEALSS